MVSAQSLLLIANIFMASGVVFFLASAVIWFAGDISAVIFELKGKKTKKREKLRVIEDLMIVNSKERIDY